MGWSGSVRALVAVCNHTHRIDVRGPLPPKEKRRQADDEWIAMSPKYTFGYESPLLGLPCEPHAYLRRKTVSFAEPVQRSEGLCLWASGAVEVQRRGTGNRFVILIRMTLVIDVNHLIVLTLLMVLTENVIWI